MSERNKEETAVAENPDALYKKFQGFAYNTDTRRLDWVFQTVAGESMTVAHSDIHLEIEKISRASRSTTNMRNLVIAMDVGVMVHQTIWDEYMGAKKAGQSSRILELTAETQLLAEACYNGLEEGQPLSRSIAPSQEIEAKPVVSAPVAAHS